MPRRIRGKLLIAFSTVILPVIAAGGILALYLGASIHKFDHTVRSIAEERAVITNLTLSFERALMPGNDYIITGDNKYIDDFYKVSIEMEKRLKEAGGIAHKAEERKILNDAVAAWQNIKEISQRIFEVRNPFGNREAIRLMEEIDYKWAYPVIERLKVWRELHTEEFQKAAVAADRVWLYSRIILFGSAFALMAAGLFLSFFYASRFSRPIEKIHNVADAIAGMDFKFRLDIKTGDEIEQLANAVNEMAVQLESSYSNLEQKVEERTRELRESGAALRKSNERFDLAVKGTNDGIWDWDIETNTNYFSPRFLELLNYGPDELAHELTTFEFLLHPDDRAWVFDRVRQHLEDKVPYNVEYRMRTKNGEYRWFQARGEAIRNQSGKPFRMAGSITDIMERKEAEEKLRATRDYLGNLLDYANAPIIVWDLLFRITMFNHAFERMTGRDASEVIGKEIDVLFPADRKDEALFHIRQTKTGERWETVEIPILHTNGTVRTALWNSATLYSADGKSVVATIAQGQDITERKQAERRLRETNLLLGCISKSQAQFIAGADPMEAFSKVLDQLLVITESEYGFIAETLHDDKGVPYIRDFAISDIAWSKATRAMYEIASSTGLEFRNLNTLFGAVVTSGKPVIANDPANDPRSGGLPEGHPPLNTFLGIPIYNGEEPVGIFAVANRPGGYDEMLVEYIRPFTETLATMIEFVRGMRQRKKMEERIKEQLDYLERFQKVAVNREFRMKELRDENESLNVRLAELKEKLRKSQG